jgi:son of sevenless-like protein
VITLEPINQAMELIRSAVRVKKIAHLQPSTACAISAIRSLLLATDCLSRESSLLAQFPLLGKVRKTILANLAELVALARSASQHPNERHAGFGSSGLEGEEEMEEFREAELEGMLKSSEETFSNVRVFLRTLVRCGIALPERKDADHLSEVDEERLGIGGSGIGPSRIPHSRGNSSPGEVLFGRPGSRMGTEVRRERERGTNLQAKSMGDLRLARRPLRTEEDGSMSGRTGSGHARKSSSSSFLEVEGEGSSFRKGRSRLGQDAGSISSVSSIGSSADYHAAVHHRQASGDATRSRSQSQVETVDIIVGIGMTFDSLLSVTAALIGHVQCHTVASHPSSHALLVDLSRETIDKIRDLLAIVELVINHDSTARSHGREIIQLDQAKRQMYETTSALVEAAERVASTPFREIPTEEDEINRERLLASASVIMRPARECVRLVKVCGNRRESLEALGMGTGIGLGVVTDMRGLPERSVDFGSSEDVTIQPGHRRRESQASVASSRSTRNRELSSTSSSTSGSYGRSAGPYSAPLDKGFREQIEEQEEVMVTPAEQTARNRITVSIASGRVSGFESTADFSGLCSVRVYSPLRPLRCSKPEPNSVRITF